MIDHKQNLIDMAEQLEQPFWTGPTGADAALAEQAKALRAAAAHLQRAEQDSKRLDWLADKNNTIGKVLLPTACVARNLHSLRAAIDEAMNHFEGVLGVVEPEHFRDATKMVEVDND